MFEPQGESGTGMGELANLDAVVLAGGLGTRLRAVVADRQKTLAEVAGRPFLAHLLDRLAHAGIKRVVLCTGYLGKQVHEFFGDTYAGLRLIYSREQRPLGTAGALRLAVPLLESDPVLVLNGDSFCHADFEDLRNRHCVHDRAVTVVVVQVSDTARFGRITLDEKGLITGFEEKGMTSGKGWINAGIYLISRPFLLTIPQGRAVSLEREMFPVWINHGFYGYRCDGPFLDIGTPESYASAEAFFAGKS
jgi:D-glycero-alpha-D-manno-heptose 1-phosphate guanylyltransferase